MDRLMNQRQAVLVYVAAVAALSLVTTAFGAGCGRKLSKDDAQKMLQSNVREAMSKPQCVWKDFKLDSDAKRTKQFHLTFVDSPKPTSTDLPTSCLDGMKQAGILAEARPPKGDYEIGRYGNWSTSIKFTSEVSLTWDDEGFCTATIDCGDTSFVVDSITTEGKRATIRYHLHRETSDRWLKLKSCGMMVSNGMDEAKVATATLNDDGEWQ